MSISRDAAGLAADVVDEIARTGRTVGPVTRARAIALVAERREERSARLLVGLVVDRSIPGPLRRLAASGLATSTTPGSTSLLIEAAAAADADTAPVLARALGRLGALSDRRHLDRLSDLVHPAHRWQVEFSKSLLSYRHHGERDLVDTRRLRAFDLDRDESAAVKFEPATEVEIERAMHVVRHQPIGIELTPADAHRIRCHDNTFVWVWTTTPIPAANTRRRTAVIGILVRSNDPQRHPTMTAIGLATRAGDDTSVTLHRASTGHIAYVGLLADDGRLRMSSVDEPGNATFELTARLDAKQLSDVDGRSASTVDGRSPLRMLA